MFVSWKLSKKIQLWIRLNLRVPALQQANIEHDAHEWRDGRMSDARASVERTPDWQFDYQLLAVLASTIT